MTPKAAAGVLVILLTLTCLTGCGGSNSTAPKDSTTSTPAPPPKEATKERQIKAPIDVTSLPYYNSSWTFTDKGGTIEVQTDLYRDDEGEEFGMAICNLTRFSGNEDKDVMVLAADGGPLAHRFEESLTSSGTCEKG